MVVRATLGGGSNRLLFKIILINVIVIFIIFTLNFKGISNSELGISV
jgi:hypothetical protein